MISGSLASAEAIAHIMTQKFVMASPLYRTGWDDGPPIVLHEYQPSRKAEHVEKFLKGFSGFLHADGCQGFRRLPENIRVAGCRAPVRRTFHEALNALPLDKRKDTAALTGLECCNQLSALGGAVQATLSSVSASDKM